MRLPYEGQALPNDAGSSTFSPVPLHTILSCVEKQSVSYPPHYESMILVDRLV